MFKILLPLSYKPQSVVLRDLDGDGDADVIASSATNGRIVVLRNETPAPFCPGDCDADLYVDVNDLNIVLSNWGRSVAPGSNGDLSEDGVIGVDDLNTVLSNWGGVCGAS